MIVLCKSKINLPAINVECDWNNLGQNPKQELMFPIDYISYSLVVLIDIIAREYDVETSCG